MVVSPDLYPLSAALPFLSSAPPIAALGEESEVEDDATKKKNCTSIYYQ
jgi:hypothetical protein